MRSSDGHFSGPDSASTGGGAPGGVCWLAGRTRHDAGLASRKDVGPGGSSVRGCRAEHDCSPGSTGC